MSDPVLAIAMSLSDFDKRSKNHWATVVWLSWINCLNWLFHQSAYHQARVTHIMDITFRNGSPFCINYTIAIAQQTRNIIFTGHQPRDSVLNSTEIELVIFWVIVKIPVSWNFSHEIKFCWQAENRHSQVELIPTNEHHNLNSFTERKQLWENPTCEGRLICPERRVSSFKQMPLLRISNSVFVPRRYVRRLATCLLSRLS